MDGDKGFGDDGSVNTEIVMSVPMEAEELKAPNDGFAPLNANTNWVYPIDQEYTPDQIEMIELVFQMMEDDGDTADQE